MLQLPTAPRAACFVVFALVASVPLPARAGADVCPIHPIAVPASRVDGLAPGTIVDRLDRGTGAGNFGWIQWSAAGGAQALATSLTPPGDSDTYVDPDDAADRRLDPGDWVRGAPGSLNAAAVRTALDALKARDVIVPVWDATRGQGGSFDYRVQRFATIRLRDWQLTGRGSLSFEYRGEATCNDTAPVALPQALSTDEDTPLPIVLTGTDADGDALTFAIVDAPAHGTLSGTTPALTYTPAPGFHGADAFTFRASDGTLQSAPATVSITVVERNAAPVIVSLPPASVAENAVYDYDIDAVDPDGDVLAYDAPTAPLDTTVAASTGALAWLADPALAEGVRTPNLVCREALDDGDVAAVVAWAWTESTSQPDYDQVIVAPLVAPLHDTNGNGRSDAGDEPRVVLSTYSRTSRVGCCIAEGRLRVLRGSDGTELLTTSADHPVDGFGTPALGDIDGDGLVDIVAPSFDAGVTAFRNDGSVIWHVPALHATNRLGRVAQLADLDADGDVEIVVEDTVLDADGQVLWRLTAYGGRSIGAAVPSVADVDGDGFLEVIAGASAYSHDGAVQWQNATVGDGYTAIADFDGDAQPEVVVVRNGYVALVRAADGATVWGPIALPDGTMGGGPPTIGDFDADGRPEIGVAGDTHYVALDSDGSVMWSVPTKDRSSRVTGSTVFDLDGDGRVEVLYNDESFFRIYDGATGQVRHETASTSGTVLEYPVVADVDLDGHAEILVGSNELLQILDIDPPPGTHGVRAYRSAGGGWMPTRAIWNQHAYSIDNVDDDGRVPRVPAQGWLTHNSFRLNTFADRHPLGLADLALFDLRLDASGSAITVLATNRGLAPSAAATSVRIFSGATPLDTIAVPVLAAGESRTLTLAGIAPGAVLADLVARIDEAGAVTECLEDNNATAAALFDVRAHDPGGLFDSQRFTVTVQDVNAAPAIPTAALPPAAVGAAYRFRVQATDPDRGDGLRYDLADAPAGLGIEPVTGELRWTPLATQSGTHVFRVRVTDLAGASVARSFELLVNP